MRLAECDDCGMIDPPDDHECQQYENRIKAERELMTVEEILKEHEMRLHELERRVASLSISQSYSRPWSAR